MLPTPFDASGGILWDDIAPIISYQLDNGAHGIAALGLGGEASRLAIGERMEVADRVLRAAPRGTRVLIGISSDDTENSCALARHAAERGATAVMVAPPRIPAMNRQALRDHYFAVCDAAAFRSLPFVCFHHLVDLAFYSRQIEGGWRLHRRKFDGRFGELRHRFLHKDKAPEFPRVKVVHIAAAEIVERLSAYGRRPF